jgi:hypothetical protein
LLLDGAKVIHERERCRFFLRTAARRRSALRVQRHLLLLEKLLLLCRLLLSLQREPLLRRLAHERESHRALRHRDLLHRDVEHQLKESRDLLFRQTPVAVGVKLVEYGIGELCVRRLAAFPSRVKDPHLAKDAALGAQRAHKFVRVDVSIAVAVEAAHRDALLAVDSREAVAFHQCLRMLALDRAVRAARAADDAVARREVHVEHDAERALARHSERKRGIHRVRFTRTRP